MLGFTRQQMNDFVAKQFLRIQGLFTKFSQHFSSSRYLSLSCATFLSDLLLLVSVLKNLKSHGVSWINVKVMSEQFFFNFQISLDNVFTIIHSHSIEVYALLLDGPPTSIVAFSSRPSVHPSVLLSVRHAPYLRNCKTRDYNFWHKCVK